MLWVSKWSRGKRGITTPDRHANVSLSRNMLLSKRRQEISTSQSSLNFADFLQCPSYTPSWQTGNRSHMMLLNCTPIQWHIYLEALPGKTTCANPWLLPEPPTHFPFFPPGCIQPFLDVRLIFRASFSSPSSRKLLFYCPQIANTSSTLSNW